VSLSKRSLISGRPWIGSVTSARRESRPLRSYHGQARALEHPGAAHHARDALDGWTLGPVKQCRGRNSFPHYGKLGWPSRGFTLRPGAHPDVSANRRPGSNWRTLGSPLPLQRRQQLAHVGAATADRNRTTLPRPGAPRESSSSHPYHSGCHAAVGVRRTSSARRFLLRSRAEFLSVSGRRAPQPLARCSRRLDLRVHREALYEGLFYFCTADPP